MVVDTRSAYELQRDNNVQRNNAFLWSIGLGSGLVPPKVVKPKAVPPNGVFPRSRGTSNRYRMMRGASRVLGRDSSARCIAHVCVARRSCVVGPVWEKLPHRTTRLTLYYYCGAQSVTRL